GRDLMREREYSKAIDAYLTAKSSHQLFLSRISKVASVPTDVAQGNIIGNLISLGTLYIRTGQLEQALSQYLNAFELIKQWGIKFPYTNSIHQGMGEVFLQQKNFPEALENFQKALALAEGQRRPGSIRAASERIAYILARMGKPEEAIPHYTKAIGQVESIRSRLQSAEYRQSFFEGAMGTYGGAIGTFVYAKKCRDGFDYSERARSRAFLDVLGTRAKLSKAQSKLLAEERALNERIAALKANVSLTDGEDPRDAFLRAELRQAEETYNDFLAKVSK